MAVQVGACGRLRVEDGAADRAVGRGVAREVLALLVLHRDQPLDVAAVVDALWPGEPPATARTIVHGAVSRLRKALGPDTVALVDDGYALDDEHVEVDLWAGLDLLAAGRDGPARGVLVEPLLGADATRPWAADGLAAVRREIGGAARRHGEPWVVEPPEGPASALSRLVGRRRELQALRTALDRFRLVTIVGLGGVGKSRLATEALLDVGGTVVRVDLGRGSRSFAEGLTGAVGAVPTADEGVARAVLGNLLEGVDLLVVDGCEVDVDGSADAIALLLRRRPGLRVLATSRTALGVAGEHLLPLLPFDDPGDPRGDAVDLLLDRVRSLGLPFVDGDRERAAAVCRSCAGVPLAIELAVAGLLDGHLAPAEPARAPAVVLRQRIDGSIVGLTPGSVTIARRLALLAAGTTVGLAERLGGGSGPASVRELLSAGLLAVEAGPAGRRFHLLDTIRLVLLERVDAGDRLAAASALAELAAPASPPAGAGPDVADLALAVPEIENAHGLLRALVADGRHVERLALARAFATPWSERGYNALGGEELLAAVEACRQEGAVDPEVWAEVVATALDVFQSFEAAAEHLDLVDRALPAAAEAGRDDLVAWLSFTRACGLGYRGDMGEAVGAVLAARDAAERAGAEALALRIRSLLAVAWSWTGDQAGPRAEMEAVTRRLVELGSHGQAARSYLAMAQMARHAGDRDQALTDVRQGEEHATAGLSRVSLVWLRLEHAELELELVDAAGAPLRTDLTSVRESLQAAVEVADAVGQLRISGMCRVRLGVLDGDVARLADAAAGLLPTDSRCAALALASLHQVLGRRHPLRRLLPGVVAELAAQPGGLLVSDADIATVQAAADTAAGRLPADWREQLDAALLDLAVEVGPPAKRWLSDPRGRSVHHGAVVRIEACGAFRVEGPEADRALGRGVARELLAVLVASRGEWLDTPSIVDLLWAGEPPATAGTIVHGAVARIRRALGADAVARSEAGYRLDPAVVEVDLWEAVDLADAGRLAEARHRIVEPLLGAYGHRAWTGPVLMRARAIADHTAPGLGGGRRAPWGAATGRLVGRRRELAVLRDARRRSRLVTVVGMGGVGKSRLVTEVLDEVTGTVARVDLGRGSGPFATRALIVLGAVPPEGSRAALLALEGLVAGVDTLVVDGCEHDLEGAADGLALLLDRWPALSVLATSRVALGVAGERVVPLLPFDDPADPRGDAVDLLLDRMQALGLPLTAGDRDRAAAVVQRCAGVPLAIELAAAQLLGGADAAPPGGAPEPIVRNHVAEAVGSLTPPAQDAVRGLALLPAGASGRLVGDLVGGGAGVVRELVTAALLVAEATTAGRRFYLPDTVRQVLGGLTGASELRAAAAALSRVAGPASPDDGTTAPVDVLAAGIAEIGNARAVLRSLAAIDEHRLRLSVAMAFRMPFFEEGHWAWGAQELQAALAAVESAGGIDPVERAEVVAGIFEVAGSFQAFAHLVPLAGPAAEVAEAVGRVDLVVGLRYAEAAGHGYAGRVHESAVAASAVRAAATRSGSEALLLRADGLDALALMVGGRPADARQRFVDIAERALDLGWPGPSARVRHIACMAAKAAGELDWALLDARVAEERAEAGLARANLAAIRADIAELEHALGASPEAAREALARAVEVATSTGQLRLSGTCRLRLAVLDDDLASLAHATLELLEVDQRSAAGALAHVVDRIGPGHPLHPTATVALGVLGSGAGAPLPAADEDLVRRLAAEPAGLAPDWLDELRRGLAALAGGR